MFSETELTHKNVVGTETFRTRAATKMKSKSDISAKAEIQNFWSRPQVGGSGATPPPREDHRAPMLSCTICRLIVCSSLFNLFEVNKAYKKQVVMFRKIKTKTKKQKTGPVPSDCNGKKGVCVRLSWPNSTRFQIDSNL